MGAPINNKNAAKPDELKATKQKTVRFTDSEKLKIDEFLLNRPDTCWAQWSREAILDKLQKEG